MDTCVLCVPAPALVHTYILAHNIHELPPYSSRSNNGMRIEAFTLPSDETVQGLKARLGVPRASRLLLTWGAKGQFSVSRMCVYVCMYVCVYVRF